jgi:hypothetical protein
MRVHAKLNKIVRCFISSSLSLPDDMSSAFAPRLFPWYYASSFRLCIPPCKLDTPAPSTIIGNDQESCKIKYEMTLCTAPLHLLPLEFQGAFVKIKLTKKVLREAKYLQERREQQRLQAGNLGQILSSPIYSRLLGFLDSALNSKPFFKELTLWQLKL